MLRWSPGHPQQLKDPSLIPALDQTTLIQLLALLPTYHIRIQSSLVETHPLLTGQEPHAAVEDVIAREIDQRRPDV